MKACGLRRVHRPQVAQGIDGTVFTTIKSPNITVSESGLMLTKLAPDGWATAFADDIYTPQNNPGKMIFEVELLDTNACMVGVGEYGVFFGNYDDHQRKYPNGSWMVHAGRFYYNGAQYRNRPIAQVGDTLTIGIDLAAIAYHAYINGTLSFTETWTTMTNRYFSPAISLYLGGLGLRVNAGATPLKYPIEGFIPGWPKGAV